MKRSYTALLTTALLVGSVSVTTVARADLIDDWLAHSAANLEPQVSYSGDPFDLKFSHPAPPASIVPPVWQATLDWLSEATNGAINFTQFGGGSLVAIRDGFKGMSAGISDYGTCYSAFEGQGFEMSKVFQQPFINSGRPLVDTRIFMELAPEYFVPEFERQGVNFGYAVHAGSTDIMSKTPIRTLEDLEGLKVIAQGLPPEVAEAFGFVTLNIPFPEIYTSVQQGIADAVIWVDAGFVPFKIYELAKFHTTIGFSSTSIDTCYNRDMYADLPADLQGAFSAYQQFAVAALAQRTGVDFRSRAFDIYQENGVEFITLADDELARWNDVAQPVVADWIAAREAAGQEGAALVAAIEELKAEYASVSDEEMLRILMEEPVPALLAN